MGRQARAPGRAIRRNGTEQHPSELGYGRRRIRATRGDAVDHSRLRGIRPVREHERSSLRPRRGRRRRVVVSRLRGHERGLAETGLEQPQLGNRHPSCCRPPLVAVFLFFLFLFFLLVLLNTTLLSPLCISPQLSGSSAGGRQWLAQPLEQTHDHA